MSRVAIVGGTGALGAGLALRWGRYGHQVTIGSREPEKATACALQMSRIWDLPNLAGASNKEAIVRSEIACITVPYSAHEDTLNQLKDVLAEKIVVDATVPLVPPKVSVVRIPSFGSLAAFTQKRLGEGVKVVSALHNVSAEILKDPTSEIDCDVMVFGNNSDACSQVIELIDHLGLRGVRAGPIENSVAAEAMTSILIGINRRYKAHGAGIRFTGISETELK